MTNNQVLIIDHYNPNQFKQLEQFSKENNLYLPVNPFEKEKAYYDLKNDNTTAQYLVCHDKNNNIKDFCFIKFEKDIKASYLYFPNLKNKFTERKIINQSVFYAVEYLKSEEVFSTVNTEDKKLLNELVLNGFTYLGEENGIAYCSRDPLTIKKAGNRLNENNKRH